MEYSHTPHHLRIKLLRTRETRQKCWKLEPLPCTIISSVLWKPRSDVIGTRKRERETKRIVGLTGIAHHGGHPLCIVRRRPPLHPERYSSPSRHTRPVTRNLYASRHYRPGTRNLGASRHTRRPPSLRGGGVVCLVVRRRQPLHPKRERERKREREKEKECVCVREREKERE